jgi:hypothetical protein
MSFVVIYLPSLEELKIQFESNPDIIRYYLKFEGFNGDSDSVKYLQEKIKTFLKKH